MKTILFLEQQEGADGGTAAGTQAGSRLLASFRDNAFLLDEFLEEGRVSLCDWHAGGASVAEAVPDLPALLAGEEQWRAVIVADLRTSDEELRDDAHFDNPFDFPESYGRGPGDAAPESSRPLIRLTQMLGGVAERPYIAWNGEDTAADAGKMPSLMGNDISYAERGDEFDLLERYRLGLSRPRQIVCVTPRDVDRAFAQAKERIAQHDGGAAGASSGPADAASGAPADAPTLDFWQRNAYPPQARFVVFDREAPAKPAKREEAELAGAGAPGSEVTGARRAQADDTAFWLSFWIGVLLLSVADFAPSLLRAYTLNRLTLGIDSAALEEMLAARRAQWVGACHAIQTRYEGDAARLVPSEHVMGEMPPTEETILVEFDLVSTERLYSDPSQVGFIKDEPENDKSVWGGQRQRIEAELRELLLAPRRALRNAAARFRQTKPFAPEELEYCILNEYQKDKLADDLRAQEYDFTRDVGRPPFEFASHEGMIAEHGKLIEAEIERRASKRQALAAGGIALVALALGLWPYCTGIMGGVGSSVAASFVSLACCAVVVVVWLASLASMRRRVRSEYLSLNTDMGALSGELSTEAARLEAKISSCASFRRKWSILQRQSHKERPTSEMHWLRRKELTLRKRIGYIDGIVRACGLDEADVRMREPRDYEWRELAPLLDEASFLNVRQGGIAFELDDDSGRKVGPFSQVPYDFIADAAVEPLKVE